jgi:hypothetical protein
MMAGEILAMGAPSEVKNEARKMDGRKIETMEDAFIALIESKNGEKHAKTERK